ncbi:MAG: glucose-1-phosphate cytidylyltransferase [Chloroflexi bacterium]|nr:glucose-1-phosphate cytidylyltransferase [Chloroflexota bacterium]|tara:strand:- start:88 stop:804 length:717 start_codon:yes stop_codon:yes gene_type:complete
MDVIIFCGGRGSRMSDETYDKPKPMISIGDKPILWHIMKMYSNKGFNRFILTLGYKGDVIKSWFDKNLNNENWDINFIDTGIDSEKGARLKKVEKNVGSDNFHVTYGDGVSDIDLSKLVEFHNEHNGEATMTVVRPPSRFGFVSLDGNIVDEFEEKPQMQTGFINGGFFIFNKSIFNYLNDKDDCDLEYGTLDVIAKKKKLHAFKHNGFWQCMDNIREKEYLDEIIKSKEIPWLENNV